MAKANIGGTIQRRRKSLGITQQHLAEMAGLTSRTIYQIESGTGNPTLESLQKASYVLGLEIMIQVRKVEE